MIGNPPTSAIHVIGAASVEPARTRDLAATADFRKATKNMLWAYATLRDALAKISFPSTACGMPALSDAALVLGSSYGELETTKEFLRGLALQSVARPLLFQNSLHNATVGFLAVRLAFTGPTLTVSNRHFTAEDSLQVARDLIEQGYCSLCAVTCVDTRVEDLAVALESTYPAEIRLGEGAATLVLASDARRRALGAPSLARLGPIAYRGLTPGEPGGSTEKAYYDSQALSELAERIRQSPPESEDRVRFRKPDGTESVVTLLTGESD